MRLSPTSSSFSPVRGASGCRSSIPLCRKDSRFRLGTAASVCNPAAAPSRFSDSSFGSAASGCRSATGLKLTDTHSKLTLNLFDDTVLAAIVERTAPTSSGYSLAGRIEGVELGTVTLVVNGTVVAGSVRAPVGTFRIRPVGKRLYAISEVDESKLPPVD